MLTGAGEGSAALWESVVEKRQLTTNGFGELGETAEAIALNCADQAMKMAGWARLNSDDGFILATTTAQAPLWENDLVTVLRRGPEREGEPLPPSLNKLPLGDFTATLARHWAFTGRTQLVTSACAASIHALGLASSWLRSGKVKRCLVGGTEVLCTLIRSGFESLQLISKSPCKPFDSNRTGINLSEGGAFLCLESAPNAKPIGQILGHGSSLDAYHPTSPHPQGQGSVRAIQRALEMAALSPSQIDWVHAHGTGSLHNDQAEALAIQSVFSGVAIPPVTSTKGTHGHFLGATGIIEVALVVESLRRQVALPTTGFVSVDPKVVLPVLAWPQSQKIDFVLKNVLGFGGTNGALVVARV